jgi:tRNA dimethylallyltransferase
MGLEKRKPNIVVICGPTGIGKTSVGIDLAESFSAEIVSADSMQVYRRMNIGTAKPTAAETARTPHHMIDIVNPDEPFDAACYARAAKKILLKLDEEGKLPLIVGGTGLYVKSLVHGLFQAVSTDRGLRNRLEKEAKIHGSGHLYATLKQRDVKTAERLHPNDTYRILRALEVLETTGRSISDYQSAHGFRDRPFQVLKIGLIMDREALYRRIDLRVDFMIQNGFLEEVKGLLNDGFGPNLKSMRSIGYRHLVDHIQGRLSWNETLQTLKRDTRRYAKRQLTWFRRDPEIVWSEPDRIGKIKDHIRGFLKWDESRA